jgi:hypothetical protein
LSLWRGPALDGLPPEACRAEAVRLEERRLAVLEERIDVDLGLRRHAPWSPSYRRSSVTIRCGSACGRS